MNYLLHNKKTTDIYCEFEIMAKEKYKVDSEELNI
jgi:hypothetical protein